MNAVLHTIGNGLTYEGQWLHLLINYPLIVLTVMPFVLQRGQFTQPEQRWKICLLLITLLQVAIWFIADAVGVSLIWSAMAGFLALDNWRSGLERAKPQQRLARIALIAALAALLYYAITFPVITTVAHLVAALVGVSLFLCLPRK